jgi:pimeloyl-ACP methyl ester carboxylesterase
VIISHTVAQSDATSKPTSWTKAPGCEAFPNTDCGSPISFYFGGMTAAAAKELLLIPGLLCNRLVFQRQLERLHKRLPQLTVHVAANDTHDTIAALAAHLLAAAPRQLAIVGFSFGGYVALEMLRQAPERITHLGLVSTQARADSAVIRQRRQHQIDRAHADGNLHAVLAEQLPALLHPSAVPSHVAAFASAGIDPHTHAESSELSPAELVRLMAHRTGVERFIRQQRAIMSRSDTRAQLTAAAARGLPVSIVAGRQDALMPLMLQTQLFHAARGDAPGGGVEEDAAPPVATSLVVVNESSALSARLPLPTAERRVSLTLLDQCGHMSPLEQPDAVSAAVEELLQI